MRQFQAAPQAIKFLQEITLPNDCVISDNPAFSSQANRFPPPILSEPSDARIASGDLSLDLIEAVAAEHNCKALVATSHRFKKDIPGMRMWAEGFFSHYVNFEGTRIYYQGP